MLLVSYFLTLANLSFTIAQGADIMWSDAHWSRGFHHHQVSWSSWIFLNVDGFGKGFPIK